MSTVAATLPPSLIPQPPADPQPISAALKRHFDEELSEIPSGKSGRVNVGVSMTGAQIGIGFRRGPWSASGYAGWDRTSGALAGGQAAYVW